MPANLRSDKWDRVRESTLRQGVKAQRDNIFSIGIVQFLIKWVMDSL
jgi:hypothetical protein